VHGVLNDTVRKDMFETLVFNSQAGFVTSVAQQPHLLYELCGGGWVWCAELCRLIGPGVLNWSAEERGDLTGESDEEVSLCRRRRDAGSRFTTLMDAMCSR
jgi:hypothetical protein